MCCRFSLVSSELFKQGGSHRKWRMLRWSLVANAKIKRGGKSREELSHTHPWEQENQSQSSIMQHVRRLPAVAFAHALLSSNHTCWHAAGCGWWSLPLPLHSLALQQTSEPSQPGKRVAVWLAERQDVCRGLCHGVGPCRLAALRSVKAFSSVNVPLSQSSVPG